MKYLTTEFEPFSSTVTAIWFQPSFIEFVEDTLTAELPFPVTNSTLSSSSILSCQGDLVLF